MVHIDWSTVNKAMNKKKSIATKPLPRPPLPKRKAPRKPLPATPYYNKCLIYFSWNSGPHEGYPVGAIYCGPVYMSHSSGGFSIFVHQGEAEFEAGRGSFNPRSKGKFLIEVSQEERELYFCPNAEFRRQSESIFRLSGDLASLKCGSRPLPPLPQ